MTSAMMFSSRTASLTGTPKLASAAGGSDTRTTTSSSGNIGSSPKGKGTNALANSESKYSGPARGEVGLTLVLRGESFPGTCSSGWEGAAVVGDVVRVTELAPPPLL